MAASDIPLARQALAVLRRGGTPDTIQSEALARVDRIANARRPLADYGRSTANRYLRAAAAGSDAHSANQIEYQRRQARGPSRSRVQRAADRNARALGNESLGQFDDDQIEELINLVGTDGAMFMLQTQYNNIKAYKRGDSAPGRDAWNERPDIVERYRKGLGADEYTVPYFWYRARK